MRNNDNPCLSCNGKPEEIIEKCTSCGFREEQLLADMATKAEEQEHTDMEQ